MQTVKKKKKKKRALDLVCISPKSTGLGPHTTMQT